MGREQALSLAALVALARRPGLWPTALRQGLRLAPARWWRRWPPNPTPPQDYLRFRIQTAYGDPTARPDPHDLVAYLEWCRRARV